MANTEKEKAIELALQAVERQFGKGSIMRLGNDEPMAHDIAIIPTGSVGLDIALGIGGVPRGRIVEIFGPESSGKTTLCLHIVAEAQKRGGVCGYIDAEHAMDVGYARKLGVRTDDLLLSQPDTGEQGLEIAEMLVRSGAIDVLVIDSVAALTPKAELEGDMGDSLLISQPDTGEQALEIADTLVRSGAVDVLVIDSVAALTPKAELEGEMGDSLPGLQARLMSQALRKLTGTVKKTNTMVIFINQKIGKAHV